MMVVSRTTEGLDETRKRYLPRKDNQAKAISKERKKSLGLPPAPKRIDFVLPDKLKAFTDGNLFVLHDTGPTDPKVRMIIADLLSYLSLILSSYSGLSS
jgi:hypothetical protein